MSESTFRKAWLPVMFVFMLALGACTGEIPPELLEAAAIVESNGEGEIKFDLSELAEELEFVGEVQSISTAEWMIANLNFRIGSSSEIKGNPSVGDLVKVHASLTADGALLAREIEPAEGDEAFVEDDDDALPFDMENEFEFIGMVELIGVSEWTIAGRTVVILPLTEIKGVISEGDLVKVHAFLNEKGEFAAREIEPTLEGDENDGFAFDLAHEFEFVGIVERMDSSTWMIGGRTVVVLPETEVKGEIAEGTLVKVHAFLNPAGELAAREIEPAFGSALDENDLDDDNDLTLTGVVEQITAESWVVDGKEFRVTPATEIDDEINVGDLVEVYFLTNDEGDSIAREIELEDESGDDLEDSDGDDLDDDDNDELDDDDDDQEDDHDDDDDKGDD
jgi:hypothetical protein